jgi:uncharacterized protein
MKLHLSGNPGLNTFTGYGPGYVAVNQERYSHSIVVMAAMPVERWAVESYATMTRGSFDALLALQPEIILLGTGATLRFPPGPLLAGLAAAQVGFEAMDTGAACRTYNILVAEGRKALAAILVE